MRKVSAFVNRVGEKCGLGGGANVLYLDGHVDFMKFPDGRPVSPDVLWITECVGVAGGTSVPERAKR